MENAELEDGEASRGGVTARDLEFLHQIGGTRDSGPDSRFRCVQADRRPQVTLAGAGMNDEEKRLAPCWSLAVAGDQDVDMGLGDSSARRMKFGMLASVLPGRQSRFGEMPSAAPPGSLGDETVRPGRRRRRAASQPSASARSPRRSDAGGLEVRHAQLGDP